jgi:type IV pilus assembly protein PilW
LKPSSRSCDELGARGSPGLTLVELLVALAVGMVIAVTALTLALGARRIYDADEARTSLNQQLGGTMTMLVADIRQAGERLGGDFPALEILDGASGAPDQLILRRNLDQTVLRVCSDTSAPDLEIDIAQTSSPVQGCAVVPDDDGDGWPENLQAWRAYRQAAGGSVRAYIYNPVTGQGEFFDYVAEDAGNYRIRANSGTSWSYSYPVNQLCRLYLLEERRYRLSGDMLQIELNGDPATPLRLAAGFDDFQASALFQDFSEQDSLGPADGWADLRAVRLELSGTARHGGELLRRSWTNEVMPRNVLSN